MPINNAARKIDRLQLHARRKRIAAAEMARQPLREIDDHRAFAAQAGAFDAPRQTPRIGDELLRPVEQAVDDTAQARRELAGLQLGDARAARLEILTRQIDAIEIAMVLGAILQMV